MSKIRGIFANLLPIRIENTDDFGTTFSRCLASSEKIFMCTGYVATESIVELSSLLEEFTQVKDFQLLVGMAKFDGLTRSQLLALEKLNSELENQGRGAVLVATAIPIHAKVTLFSGGNNQVLVGSSNLGSLTRATRQYEVDLLVNDDSTFISQVEEFIERAKRASEKFSQIKDGLRLVINDPHPLENLAGVSRPDLSNGLELDPIQRFEIEIGTGEKSNLNTFFGKGRKSIDGRLLPRPWYEVELIVSKTITELPGYPVKEIGNGEFRAITDDGFSFLCKTSGDYSKNLRSSGDLETLGRWLKGRLERAGVLNPGELVTHETLAKYGRSTLTLQKIKNDSSWYLDFGVKNANR